MTHYTVAIIIPSGTPCLESFIDTQMEPFNERLEVPAYVWYSVEQARQELDEQIQRLESFLKSPPWGMDRAYCRSELERLRSTTAEQRYQQYCEEAELLNDAGQPISTANPDAKWDWYVVGGRWDGWINGTKTCSEAIGDNIASTESVITNARIPHAIVTPDGEWHECEQLGWWATLPTDNEHWRTEALEILARVPGCQVVLLDAHI